METYPAYRTLLIIVFHCYVFLLSTFAQDSLSLDQQIHCLHYEPTVVTLKGVIKDTTFPGPPNYESIKEGDVPETYSILHLMEPICVIEDPTDSIGLNTTELDVNEIQMLYSYSYFPDKPTLKSYYVEVTGTLFHSITGHHHTPILIEILKMVPLPSLNHD